MNLKDTPLIYMYVNEFLINTAGLFQLILSGKKILCTVAVVCSKKKVTEESHLSWANSSLTY